LAFDLLVDPDVFFAVGESLDLDPPRFLAELLCHLLGEAGGG